MKKIAILLCALCVITGSANAAVENSANLPKKMPPHEGIVKMKKHHDAFEQKLGLTEVQKLKARELRKAGFEKMKPVMDELKAKKQEAEAIRRSDITVEEKERKLTVIDKDIQALEKQASEIRKQNMKDFEAILDRKQKATLKKMKKEGRARFDRDRRLTPPPCPPKFEKKA